MDGAAGRLELRGDEDSEDVRGRDGGGRPPGFQPRGFRRRKTGEPNPGMAIGSDDRFFSPCPEVQVNGEEEWYSGAAKLLSGRN